jgi:hypothetical protein
MLIAHIIAKIDPLLQIRHRLPNLAVMRFPAFKSDKGGEREKAIATLTPAYVKQVSLKKMAAYICTCTYTLINVHSLIRVYNIYP